MEWIQNTLGSIVDFFQSVWEFLVNTVGQIYEILRFIPSIVGAIFSAIAALPTFMQVFAIVTVTIMVLFLVLGRDNGSGD